MKYYLAHNEIDVFHYGELKDGQVIETGQPYLEFFDNLNDLKIRVNSFGLEFDENYNSNDLDTQNNPNNLNDILLDDVSP
jgi:hypothetical protein